MQVVKVRENQDRPGRDVQVGREQQLSGLKVDVSAGFNEALVLHGWDGVVVKHRVSPYMRLELVRARRIL